VPAGDEVHAPGSPTAPFPRGAVSLEEGHTVKPRSASIRILAALLLTLGLVACNGDDAAAPGDEDAEVGEDRTEVGEGGTEVADTTDAGDGFCDAALALGSPGEPEVDWETASEEEIAAANQVFAEERLRPVVEDLRATGPDDVQSDVDTLEQALDDARDDDGDLEAFFGGDGGAARTRITEEAAGSCGWTTLDVTMVDYGYEGVPDTVDAGQAVFAVTNSGEEGHELILFRRADGVEESWEEILELDDDEAMQRVEFVAAAFAPAGEDGSATAELQAGEHAMVCFIPVGTDASGTESGDGPPHFTEGMIATFTVQ
jgi:uncharacterized cupredoxin-like copper-binding protein